MLITETSLVKRSRQLLQIITRTAIKGVKNTACLPLPLSAVKVTLKAEYRDHDSFSTYSTTHVARSKLK